MLDDAIACGSSMMPQKKNPDVFELVRGQERARHRRAGPALHHPEGSPRRLQPRPPGGPGPLLGTAATCSRVLGALRVALPRIRLRRRRAAGRRRPRSTQATDVAEALVRTGVPFRVRVPPGGRAGAEGPDRGSRADAGPGAGAGTRSRGRHRAGRGRRRARRRSAASGARAPPHRPRSSGRSPQLRQAAARCPTAASPSPGSSTLFTALSRRPRYEARLPGMTDLQRREVRRSSPARRS